jgi:hypothetical protein
MQQAQSAIDAAREAGADQYGHHEEYVAAQELLKLARQAADNRDYRLALNHALDSRERAQNAGKQAADNKAAARADAERTLAAAATALTDARSKLKLAAASGRFPSRVALARRRIADNEAAVQKARAAFDEDNYRSVIDTAGAVTARLRGVTRDLEAIVPPAARRRR